MNFDNYYRLNQEEETTIEDKKRTQIKQLDRVMFVLVMVTIAVFFAWER